MNKLENKKKIMSSFIFMIFPFQNLWQLSSETLKAMQSNAKRV